MKTTILTTLFASFILSLNAQTMKDSINSGPSYRAFPQSSIWAGAGWNTANYNDSAWTYAYNGGASDGGGACLGPNTSIWGGEDTCIWTKAISIAPDTGCFRSTIFLSKCGKVVAAELSVNADDYVATYINGNLLGTQPSSNIGVYYSLDSVQLLWLRPGDNVFAYQAINSSPHCGQFGVTGSITIDTVGCYIYTGIDQITNNNFVVTPNPTRGPVSIKTSADLPYSLKVFDVIGNLVNETYSAQSDINIDLRNDPSGIYFVQIRFANGRVMNKKIVKE